MSWLDDIFAKKTEETDDAQDSSDLTNSAPNAMSNSAAAQTRELINRAAHEVLKLHGVPREWVKFEILTLTDAAKVYFQLQVTLIHWDAYLLLHSWAFEQAVSERIRERSVQMAQALRAVLWRVAPNAGCPYESMPASVAWTPEAIAQRQNHLELFKVHKPREEVPADWSAEHQHGGDSFLPTLQMPQSTQEADAELQRALQVSSGRTLRH